MRNSLGRMFGHQPKPTRTNELAGAYRRLFRGQGNQDDADVVLADLADHCGFFKVSKRVPDAALQFNEGRRHAFNRIFTFLSLTPEEVEDLAKATRGEFLQKTEEGEYL